MSYEVFIRDWWIEDSSWPNGLAPGPGPSEHFDYVKTEEEAKKICQEYNSTHVPGRLSRKAEYSRC